MGNKWKRLNESPLRELITLLAWVVVIVWSVYLIAGEAGGDGGTFPLLVQIMGSLGILYALFLVTRPRNKGMLDVFAEVSRREREIDPKPDRREPSSAAARWAIITITLALAIGALIYRLTHESYLHQSALFFIGVPAVLAITLALSPKAKSATGMIVKGLTLALLLSGVVFAEGFVCILMAAPLFYVVGIAIGGPIDRARRKRMNETRVYSIVGAALLLLSLEGLTPATTFSTQEVVRATRVIDVPANAVREALASAPDFEESLPLYLRLGFPRPVAGYGTGLQVGDRRTIVFGDESPMKPMDGSHIHHEAGDRSLGRLLELEVTESRDGLVVFEVVRDTTAFTHWISWERSIVSWEAIDRDTTEVTWRLRFDRELSPSWYFGPWQRYAGRKAAGYLIDTIATP